MSWSPSATVQPRHNKSLDQYRIWGFRHEMCHFVSLVTKMIFSFEARESEEGLILLLLVDGLNGHKGWWVCI